ncbi:hypothetical protein DNP04_23465 [Salmonella enterica subsp. enterica serovar Panama]|nr:hypothetical protein DNP04_23465 [Salmonella enterica subsp. enterica serovar Panama]
MVWGECWGGNEGGEEAEEHGIKQGEGDGVGGESVRNYEQGSVGFHVWPPDQPPLVRLNARILYH